VAVDHQHDRPLPVANRDTNSDSYRNPNRDCNRDSYGKSNRDSHSYRKSDRDCHSYRKSDRDCHSYGKSDRDCHSFDGAESDVRARIDPRVRRHHDVARGGLGADQPQHDNRDNRMVPRERRRLPGSGRGAA
jgi:hypothetical protein